MATRPPTKSTIVDAVEPDAAREPTADAVVADQRRRAPGATAERQQQVDAHQRLHDGEGAAAHLVLDLAAEQGVAGDPREAGEHPDGDGRDERRGQVGQRAPSATSDAPAAQMARPNLRRREIAAQQPRAEAHAEREADEDRAEEHAVRRVAAAQDLREEVAEADDRAGRPRTRRGCRRRGRAPAACCATNCRPPARSSRKLGARWACVVRCAPRISLSRQTVNAEKRNVAASK